MNVLTRTFDAPPLCESEVFRYAGCAVTEELKETFYKLWEEAKDMLTYRVCYTTVAVSVTSDTCAFPTFAVRSQALAKNLTGCTHAVLFAATVGMELDRLIAKYSCTSPMCAILLHALGTERVEALCDAFCQSLAEDGLCPKPRFSPGYGDLTLDLQTEFFKLLSCEKHVGIYLGETLFMQPSKSVTAFVGLRKAR